MAIHEDHWGNVEVGKRTGVQLERSQRLRSFVKGPGVKEEIRGRGLFGGRHHVMQSWRNAWILCLFGHRSSALSFFSTFAASNFEKNDKAELRCPKRHKIHA